MATTIYKYLGPGFEIPNMESLASSGMDLVTADEAWVVFFDNFVDEFSGTASFNGWTTNSDCSLTMRASGHGSHGTISANKYVASGTAQTLIEILDIGSSGRMYFENIQIDHNKDSASAIALDCGNNPSGPNSWVYLDKCLLRGKATLLAIDGGANSNSVEARNSVFIHDNDANIDPAVIHQDETMHLLNCTIKAKGAGVNCNDNATLLYNTYIHSIAVSGLTNDANVVMTYTATSEGKGNDGLTYVLYDDETFYSTAVGAEDLRIVGNSTLDNAGGSIVGSGYSVDFNDNARDTDTPDIGAFEFTPSSSHSVYLGGYIDSATPLANLKDAFLGGYITSDAQAIHRAYLGGLAYALPLTSVPNKYLGGIGSGMYSPHEAYLGGFCWGSPTGNRYVETQGRLVTKANSVDTVDQDLLVDAVVIFKGLGTSDFNAWLRLYQQYQASFNARLKIQRYINVPTIQILQVNYVLADGETVASGDPIPNFYNGARKIQVVASGTLGDTTEWANAQIDFGEPYRGSAATLYSSISGFTGSPPWMAEHVYTTSGNYCITARGVDTAGCVGSDYQFLNLASGLVGGIDYPAISISGTPRLGDVPPQLSVAFTLTPSGSWSVRSPTDSRLFWNFGNRETSKKKNPKTYYASPGLYTPVARLRWQHANGAYVWTADTLRIGYNR